MTEPSSISTAEALRQEIARLQQDLRQVQQEFDEERAVQLLEANERLVLSSLQAAAAAESAMARLDEITRTSQLDALTDTANRALMLDRLHNAMALARRKGTQLAVLFVDIDRFKHINDTHGHAVGDEVLQHVARRLQSAIRESDTVSRHSGDEFVVLLAEIKQVSDAALISEKMLRAVGESPQDQAFPMPVGISISIGIAVYPDDGDDPLELIDLADAAMYRSKRAGGSAYHFHQEPGLQGGSTSGVAAGAHGRQPPAEAANDEALLLLREVNGCLVHSALAARDDLEAKAAEATQAQLRQVRMLSTVAHELRSPLGPISIAADLMRNARGHEAQHERLQQIIKRQVAELSRIVGDLLDSTRLDTGRFSLDMDVVSLSNVLMQVVEACRPAMAARQQKFCVRMAPGPLGVRGDPVRLAQVFRNLLDNAGKYTPSGGEIDLACEERGGTVTVAVADDGIGIDPEALPRVFAPYAQESRAVDFDGGGMGIGLAVVRELVEAHGGSVAARSAGPGMGSQFVVTLPLAAAAAD